MKRPFTLAPKPPLPEHFACEVNGVPCPHHARKQSRMCEHCCFEWLHKEQSSAATSEAAQSAPTLAPEASFLLERAA